MLIRARACIWNMRMSNGYQMMANFFAALST
jgi:hypothetical protein